MVERAVLPALLMLLAVPAAAAPAYMASGDLIPPADYRDWVFLTSSLDMNYQEGQGAPKTHMLDNIFVDPASWAVFKKTGRWPDQTVFVKENRVAAGEGSINKAGQFQTEAIVSMELHVRDDARFTGGWGFFGTDGAGGKPAKLIPYQASCYSCHQDHGATQTTFTQFYPTAKPVAQKAGNYAEH
jgi:hypothetical protein